MICFAARDGKQLTFALLDEWSPAVRGLEQDRDVALVELARRYFISHGPATVQDFVWWSGLKTSDARAGLEGAAPALIKETINGVAYWMAPDAAPREDARGVLLPGFDEYLLGYKDRAAVLDAKYAARIVPGSNGVFLPTLVLDGKVAGAWKRTVKKRTVALTVTPFRPLNKGDKAALNDAADRYGKYIATPVELNVAS